MIHTKKEHNKEFDVDVKIETYIDADEKGRPLVKRVELKDAIFIGYTESFSGLEIGKSRTPHWVPKIIVEDGPQIVVLFGNGRFIGIPLTNCRFVEYCTESNRDETSLNLAKARAAKAAKAAERGSRDVER